MSYSVKQNTHQTNLFFALITILVLIVLDTAIQYVLNEASVSPLLSRLIRATLIVIVAGTVLYYRIFKNIVDQLEKSQSQYQTLFATSPVSMFIYDCQTYQFLATNQQTLRQYGYTEKDFLALTIQDFFLPQKHQHPAQALKTNLTQTNRQIRHKDGSRIDVKITTQKILWDNKPACIATVEDVTSQNKTEKHLAHQKEFLQAMFDHLPILIGYRDSQTQKIIVNQQWEKVLGWTTDDIQDKDPFKLLIPDLQAQEEALAHRQKARGNWAFFQVKTKDNQMLDTAWANIRLSDGTTIGIGQNLTLLHHAEKDIVESERRFRALFEAASEGILLVNTQGKIILVNPQMQTLFGYQQDELIGKALNKLIPKRYHNLHNGYFDQYKANPRQRLMGANKELYGQRADGTEFPVEVSLSYVKMGEEMLMLAFIIDITERKKAEKAMIEAERLNIQLQREKDLRNFRNQFLAMLTHDFRTPLSLIMSNVILLNNYDNNMTNEDRQTKLNKIAQNVTALDNIIDDIMEISRIETEQIAFKPTVINVETFCWEISQMFQDTIEPNSQIDFKAQGDLSAVKLDRNIMHYALSNLMSNAIKYSPQNPKIEFRVQDDVEHIIFAVKDNGIGIPEDEQATLFQPFIRASNVGDIRGTGLGLCIVKEYVELHQGTITFESQEGRGSTFTITIPRL